ncbi:hypothetical protein [Nguyenibacter sp. L1]|uniref:hypothetical protein n=1 Tax=Nguyenibacter sp. L1 TaxID=3049350 RepID=UPI002B4A8EDD|nr:hypothetical protein [Nguyenibacter sp. L1]WRH89572.1 hypothetical protein QN315_08280 [Nguyenibacter sp. L1]
MAASDTLENDLKRAQERIKRERLAVQQIKRAMLKKEKSERRKIEAQALCALGRAAVEFCEQEDDGNHIVALIDFMRTYLTRDSDADAIISTLGGKRVCNAVRAPVAAMPLISVVD